MVGKTDQEQVEDIKEWWEKNGKFLIIALVFMFAGVFGGQTWNNYQNSAKERMSLEYQEIMENMRAGNDDKALQLGTQFIESNAESGYAVVVALAVAKMEVAKGELDAAAQRLAWALDKAPEEALQHVTRLRLARVLIAQDKLDEALTQLTVASVGNFTHNYALLKGDIYAKKGDVASAKTAYQAALDAPNLSPQLRGDVQMKLDDLGGAGA